MPVVFAPAKLNLTLEVLGRREDGYHTLRSVMVPVGLFDRITVEPSDQPRFRSNVALPADNLVSRALSAAAPDRAFAVSLEKNIPIGGGLGGGSSDAAAVLKLAATGNLGAMRGDWLALATSLGADVPFFLAGTGALVEGIGERVTAIGILPPWWAVIALPHVSVATAAAYRFLDTARAAARAPTRPRATSSSLAATDALQRSAFKDLMGVVSNDFHAPISAAFGQIAQAIAALRAAGAAQPLLSGSGSCVFQLFENESLARSIGDRIDRAAVAQIWVAPLWNADEWRR